MQIGWRTSLDFVGQKHQLKKCQSGTSQVGRKKGLEGKISHCLDMMEWESPWRATENRDHNKVADWENVIFATQFLSWYEMNLNKRFSYGVFFISLCSLVELICLMLLSTKGNSKLYEWRGDLPQIPVNFMLFIMLYFLFISICWASPNKKGKKSQVLVFIIPLHATH